jgi:hypothetical protein
VLLALRVRPRTRQPGVARKLVTTDPP